MSCILIFRIQCPSPLLNLPLWCKVAENSQLYLHFLRIFLWLKNTSNGQRYMVGIPLVLCYEIGEGPVFDTAQKVKQISQHLYIVITPILGYATSLSPHPVAPRLMMLMSIKILLSTRL